MTTSRQQLGLRGEQAAAAWYLRRGFVVLDRRWRCRDGEIDLVLSYGSTVVFCEVKARSSDRFGTGAEAVHWRKQQRLRRLATRWLSENGGGYGAIRFDVVAVTAGKIEVIEAAF